MSQSDYTIADQDGASFLVDINNQLAAIVSNNSGATEPATKYAYQWWADTSAGLLKQRNAANNAWITIGTLGNINLGHALAGANSDITSLSGLTGNLGFVGTGNRITGDFSNATIANRVLVQTSTAASVTNFHVVGNGAGAGSGIKIEDGAILTTGNSSVFNLDLIPASDCRVTSSIRGAGIYLPMTFYTGNAERMRIDASGNVGIGGTATKKLEVNGVGSNAVIRIKETASFGVSWDIDVGTANEMRFVNNAGSPTPYAFYNGGIEQRSPEGLGYGTGAGGTVTQATSKTTAVTLNKPTGFITMSNAALAAATTVSFTVNNSLYATSDIVILNLIAGTNTAYNFWVSTASAGVFTINVRNISAGSLSEPVGFSYAIIKGVSA